LDDEVEDNPRERPTFISLFIYMGPQFSGFSKILNDIHVSHAQIVFTYHLFNLTLNIQRHLSSISQNVAITKNVIDFGTQ
jgi:hypothetical protein